MFSHLHSVNIILYLAWPVENTASLIGWMKWQLQYLRYSVNLLSLKVRNMYTAQMWFVCFFTLGYDVVVRNVENWQFHKKLLVNISYTLQTITILTGFKAVIDVFIIHFIIFNAVAHRRNENFRKKQLYVFNCLCGHVPNLIFGFISLTWLLHWLLSWHIILIFTWN